MTTDQRACLRAAPSIPPVQGGLDRLAAELACFGAPAELLRDLARASRGGARVPATPVAPACRGAVLDAPLVAAARSIEDIAIENVVGGVVRGAFAAAIARFQAQNAADPEVRAAMARVADDGCARAALALRIATFLDGLLDAGAITRVEERRREAVRALAAALGEPSAEARRACGVPTLAEALAIHRRMCDGVWGLHPAEPGGAIDRLLSRSDPPSGRRGPPSGTLPQAA